MKKITIGGDHAGFDYKREVIKHLATKGYHVVDIGPYTNQSCDYPDFAHQVAEAVASGDSDMGILICGSGQGVAITANKHQKVRAALCWQPELAELARQHNNANVLCLPARFIDLELAFACVDKFIQTDFEGGRHENRVNKIPAC